MDKSQSYHYIKDVQAVGARIGNMLLQATALGIGSCWIGEILAKKKEVYELLFPRRPSGQAALELMAVVALGYAEGRASPPRKKGLEGALLFYDWEAGKE